MLLATRQRRPAHGELHGKLCRIRRFIASALYRRIRETCVCGGRGRAGSSRLKKPIGNSHTLYEIPYEPIASVIAVDLRKRSDNTNGVHAGRLHWQPLERSRHDQERRGRGFANLSIDGPTRDSSTLLNETQSSFEKGPSSSSRKLRDIEAEHSRRTTGPCEACHCAARVAARAKAYLRATQSSDRGGACTPRSRPLVTIRVRAVHGDAMRRAKDALRVKPQDRRSTRIISHGRHGTQSRPRRRGRSGQPKRRRRRNGRPTEAAARRAVCSPVRATAERVQLEREIEELRSNEAGTQSHPLVTVGRVRFQLMDFLGTF